MKSALIRILLLSFWLFSPIVNSIAQPTTLVYNENFNSGTGGWIIGGYSPSWSYGIPSLPNIVSNGSACFTTGDAGAAQSEPFTNCLPYSGPTLNGNFYNCCERSYVESPSINLTGVTSPLLSFDFNMYCERTFDGAKVQLSIDGGLSWQDVGTYNSAVYQVFPSSVNCRELNWYNNNNVNYLSGTSGGCGSVSFTFGGSKNGWSGGCGQSATGDCSAPDIHGTNGWINATHCISAAANKSNVKIRFDFGAGSQVFSDGIAFDNVKIFDVFPVANFTSSQAPSCEPEVIFTNTSDCAETWNWNFGHPSFPGNTSALSDPVHVFPSPGNYTIQLTATDYCGGATSFVKTISVIGGNTPIIDSVKATGSGLCNNPTDSIRIFISPTHSGTSPYTVFYNFNGNNTTLTGLSGNPLLITGLSPGVYSSFEIKDDSSCTNSYIGGVTIPLNQDTLQLSTCNDTTILAGGTAQLSVSANIAASFAWTPIDGLSDPNSATPLASPENTTTYTVIATDINGCRSSYEVVVYINDLSECKGYYVPNSFTPNGDGFNDNFSLKIDPSMRIEKFEMAVYNRWGEVVFNSNNPDVTWNGSGKQEGIYIIQADFKCRNKTKSRYYGTLNLIR